MSPSERMSREDGCELQIGIDSGVGDNAAESIGRLSVTLALPLAVFLKKNEIP